MESLAGGEKKNPNAYALADVRASVQVLHLNLVPPAALPVNPGILQTAPGSANEPAWLTVWTHQYALVSAD